MDGTGEQILSRAVDKWDGAEYLKKRIPQANYNRRSFDRIFYRNSLFYLGQQWIRFSRQQNQWRPIALPDWFPRQVTNIYAAECDIMASVFMQSDPVALFSPASNAMEDIVAARSASDVSRFIDQEVDQSQLEKEAAVWLAITGNAFVVDGYDKDKSHGTKFSPDYACLTCAKAIHADELSESGGCPHCGGNTLIEARDSDGKPMGQDLPVGRMFSEIASPFEIHADLVAGTIDKSPYIYRARTYPIDVLKEMFPDEKDSIKPDDAGVDSGLFYQTAMAYLTNASTSSGGNYGGSTGSVDSVPRATLYHLYVRPTAELPNGGEALIVGNTTLWKSELSYHDEEGNPFIPVTHMTFNHVPGRLFGKTPADDMISKQVQLNKTEALIQLAMERISNPVWLLPKGIGIEAISGEPGEKVWYNPLLGGAKPERVAGAELPGSVFRWAEAIIGNMREIAHTPDVLRGDTPKGFPTFGGAQLLLERGYAGFAQALKSWGRGWTNVRRNRLRIWKEYATDERTMMVLGNDSKWEAKTLSAESVKGKISVYLEEGSIQPKSKGFQQMIVGQMIERNLLDMSDPAVRARVMHILDASDLVEAIDLDIKDAIKEREDFARGKGLRPRPGIDNDGIHASDHRKFCLTDEFQSWPIEMQQEWIKHTLYHQQEYKKQQQAAIANDPHMLNAQAKMQEIQVELAALKQQKDIELRHVQARKAIDLQAHGAKKGLDVALDTHRAVKKAMQPPVQNGNPGLHP